jgi:hypothetical protein
MTHAPCRFLCKMDSCVVRTYVGYISVVSRLTDQFVWCQTCFYFAVCTLFLQFVCCCLHYPHRQGWMMSCNAPYFGEVSFIMTDFCYLKWDFCWSFVHIFFQRLLQPIQDPGLIFSSVIILHRQKNSLNEWSAHRKAYVHLVTNNQQ